MKTMPRRLRAALAAAMASAVLSFACSDDTTAPSTTTTTVTASTTQTWSSVLYPLDAHFYYVNISGVNGTITATLMSTTPANAVVGLGIGLRGTTCLLTKSVNAVAGAQVSVPVEAGSYCVAVFDAGTVVDKVPYEVKIAFP